MLPMPPMPPLPPPMPPPIPPPMPPPMPPPPMPPPMPPPAHATAHAAHTAELAGGTLSDDARREHDTQLPARVIRDGQCHTSITSALGLDGDKTVTHRRQKVDLGCVLIVFEGRLIRLGARPLVALL